MLTGRLDAQSLKRERRKLLADDVYVLLIDALKQMHNNGHTDLSHVEIFLEAREFARTVISLPAPLEGLEDELDDLYDEACGENDAMLICATASIILMAYSKSHPGTELHNVARQIIVRCYEHPLFSILVDAGACKERKMWMEGKRMQLMEYEIREMEMEEDNCRKVQEFFEYFVEMSEGVDAESIKEQLLVLNKYNIDHHHRYDEQIGKIYQKLGEKTNLHFDKMFDISNNEQVTIGKPQLK